MAKNYMDDITKMLGVELGEWFKISKNAKICEELTYKFTPRGLYVEFIDNEGTCYFDAVDGKHWAGILNGEFEIVKLPWKPCKGAEYWYPNTIFEKVERTCWKDSTADYAIHTLDMCYRTCEEAEAHLADDYKKLTGKELEK